jgi:RNA polymerase sigma factor (sigma-70 family)
MSSEAHLNDRELLRRTRAGDAEAFGLFFRVRRSAVLGFLRVRVPSAELAADLMCETFAQALVAIHDQERELPVVPIAWLLTIARNLLIDSARRGRVEDEIRQRLAMQPLELDDHDLRAIDQAAADADVLAQLSAALPDDELAAFRGRVLEDRDYRDLASELEVSSAVVRKRVSRARARLRGLRLEGQREFGS